MSSTSIPGVHIPSKRNRAPKSASDSDSADERPLATFRRDDGLGLQTPPPSSPPRAFPVTPAHPPAPIYQSSTPPPPSSRPQLRGAYLRGIQRRFPNLDVSNFSDFDILALAGTAYDGPLEDIHKWLANEFHVARRVLGSAERVMSVCKDTLDQQADITGVKPECNDPDVKLCAIQGSDYVMRLWPGSTEGREWCLDFVHASTREPVNSPFTFKLWTVPPSMGYSSGPWQPAEARRVFSLENRFGIDTKNIVKGAEKFVLMDGQTYLLWRPAPLRSIQFTVPSRPLPTAAVAVSNLNTDVVIF